MNSFRNVIRPRSFFSPRALVAASLVFSFFSLHSASASAEGRADAPVEASPAAAPSAPGALATGEMPEISMPAAIGAPDVNVDEAGDSQESPLSSSDSAASGADAWMVDYAQFTVSADGRGAERQAALRARWIATIDSLGGKILPDSHGALVADIPGQDLRDIRDALSSDWSLKSEKDRSAVLSQTQKADLCLIGATLDANTSCEDARKREAMPDLSEFAVSSSFLANGDAHLKWDNQDFPNFYGAVSSFWESGEADLPAGHTLALLFFRGEPKLSLLSATALPQ